MKYSAHPLQWNTNSLIYLFLPLLSFFFFFFAYLNPVIFGWTFLNVIFLILSLWSCSTFQVGKTNVGNVSVLLRRRSDCPQSAPLQRNGTKQTVRTAVFTAAPERTTCSCMITSEQMTNLRSFSHPDSGNHCLCADGCCPDDSIISVTSSETKHLQLH